MTETEEAEASASADLERGEIEDIFQHLQLNNVELDDVVVGEDEIKEYMKEARWLVVGKVLTTHSFSEKT